jgi:Protein of unknown function (DUF3300)
MPLLRGFILIFVFMCGASGAGYAQTAPAPTAAQLLKAEEIDALVAPIALYPDNLLSLVLMASSYPLEVVQADRWVKENKNLKGDQLKQAVDKQGWDDSIKSLAATPEVLDMMSGKLDWAKKLGDTVLAQQPDVMDAIQRMRAKAAANKKLASTKQQNVTKRQDQGKEVIVIESADPQTVYVPYYDPAVVYGVWPSPQYPPYYFPPPPYLGYGILSAGLAFGTAYAIGRWAGNYWNGGCNWSNNNITINRPARPDRPDRSGVDRADGGNRWEHRPEHRQGVRYNNDQVRDKFGNKDLRNSAQNRMDFRGREGNQVLRPEAGGSRDRQGVGERPSQRPSVSDRPGGGERPNTADRPSRADRPGAADRPSRADRPSATDRPGRSDRPGGGQRVSGGGDGLGNRVPGGAARAQADRGRSSFAASAGGGGRFGGGGGGGGGRIGGGGGGGRGGGGGGRRSDVALKHDIALLGFLPSGIGVYRFSYNGESRQYVGFIAQDVMRVMPEAVVRGPDGHLRVRYETVGMKFQTYRRWVGKGAHLPAGGAAVHERGPS